MRGKLISMSATCLMMGMVQIGQADVQETVTTVHQEYIQEETEIIETAPEVPQIGVVERKDPAPVYTDEEAEMIKRVSMAEAGNQGADGLWMVQSVIVNRVGDPVFAPTVYEVLHQKNAFSTMTNGAYEKAPEPTAECEEAWARIEAGDICPEIVAFEGTDSDVLDQWFLYAFTYKDHKFYTKK